MNVLWNGVAGIFPYFLILCVIMSSGCSVLPPHTGHETANQREMASIQHWQVLAEDVAQEIINSLPEHADKPLSLYVEPLPGIFGSAFVKMINAELLRMGREKRNQQIKILVSPQDDCMKVTISAQVIRHRRDERLQPYPGTFTILASGIAVMRDLAWNEILVIAGAMTDLFLASQDVVIPNSELLITTSIEQGGQFIFLKNNLYYMQSSDSPLYSPPVQHRAVKSYSLTTE